MSWLWSSVPWQQTDEPPICCVGSEVLSIAARVPSAAAPDRIALRRRAGCIAVEVRACSLKPAPPPPPAPWQLAVHPFLSASSTACRSTLFQRDRRPRSAAQPSAFARDTFAAMVHRAMWLLAAVTACLAVSASAQCNLTVQDVPLYLTSCPGDNYTCANAGPVCHRVCLCPFGKPI